jgi:hypothetical protein
MVGGKPLIFLFLSKNFATFVTFTMFSFYAVIRLITWQCDDINTDNMIK